MSGPPLAPAPAPRALRSGRPRASALAGQRGQISWVTLLLVGGLIVGGYLEWVWIPIYAEVYAVRQVVRDHMNQAVKNRDDELLRRNMVAKIRSLAQVDGVDAYGQPARVPAVPLEDGDVAWERDRSSQPPVLRVSFEYTREVALPILDRVATKAFVVEESNELTIPDWGPSR
jgi:hypothetical protein